jgi:hypothetical protein
MLNRIKSRKLRKTFKTCINHQLLIDVVGGGGVPDPPEAPLGGGGLGLGNVGLGGHQGRHLLFLRTILLSNNVIQNTGHVKKSF